MKTPIEYIHGFSQDDKASLSREFTNIQYDL